MELAGQRQSPHGSFASVLCCFRCRGLLLCESNGFRCRDCAAFFPVRQGLIDHRPSEPGLYGAWYKDAAATYESDFNLGGEWPRWITQRMKEALTRHSKLPVEFMLELACGTGVLTRGYVLNGFAKLVLATDISAEMLGQAVATFSSDRVLFLIQDAHGLDVRDESVHLVSGGSALHHMLHLEQCLSEIRRVLKPGGAAVFFEPFYVGNRMIAFLLEFMLDAVKLRGTHDPAKLRRLEDTIRSYAGVIQYRHDNRLDTERLQVLDDKHLFLTDEFHDLATKCGFGAVYFESPYEMPEEHRKKVIKDITIDIMRRLQRETGVEDLSLDLESIPFLDPFSDFYHQYLLRDFSPQEFIVLLKDKD